MIPGRYHFGLIALLAIAGLVTLFLYTGNDTPAGSDDLASAKVAELAGRPAEEFGPLVRQWVPPGGGTEGALFALQAGIGILCVGGAFWYWKRLKQREQEEGKG